jgi:hypothetical protein
MSIQRFPCASNEIDIKLEHLRETKIAQRPTRQSGELAFNGSTMPWTPPPPLCPHPIVSAGTKNCTGKMRLEKSKNWCKLTRKTAFWRRYDSVFPFAGVSVKPRWLTCYSRALKHRTSYTPHFLLIEVA